MTNSLSLWPGRPSSNLETEVAPLYNMAMWESWPPALPPGMAPFLSTPSSAPHPRGLMYMCVDTHSLHIPVLSVCPANSCTLAPLKLGRVLLGSSLLPCLLWSWPLSSCLYPLNPFAAAANQGGWDGRGLRTRLLLGPPALVCHSAAWGLQSKLSSWHQAWQRGLGGSPSHSK